MKYSLLCVIKTDNNGRRNAVQQVLPDIDDSRIWNVEYENVDTVDHDDGIKVLIINISFHVESDRNGVFNSVKGIEGIIQGCEFGSYMKEIKCYHDETPARKCEVQTILRRT